MKRYSILFLSHRAVETFDTIEQAKQFVYEKGFFASVIDTWNNDKIVWTKNTI